MDAQIKKGILEMCLLMKLAKLRRLKKEGFAEQYQGEVSGGPARKYYKLSSKGELELEEKLLSWGELCEIVDKLR